MEVDGFTDVSRSGYNGSGAGLFVMFTDSLCPVSVAPGV
jgi:hypothetical protein